MTTMFKARHTKSEIWRYFEYVSVDSAKCNECGKLYSRKGRTTTSLKNHLKSAHLEQYLEFITADKVRLDKTIPKPKKKLLLSTLDRQQPQIYKIYPADHQICGLASTSRKATADYERKLQNTKTIDDDLCRDPISITMSPNRDIKPEILHEYEETQPSSNHSICMEHITSDSNTIGGSVKVEDDENVATEDSSNSPLATTHQDYSNNQDYWEEDMKRKKLRLELEYLELKNYKIKLELYEMEQRLKLNPSKFTADIRHQQLSNIECD